MGTDEREIDRRTYLGAAAAAGVAGLAGCSGTSEAATGTLATQVSDQPGDIGDFDSCVVTIVGFWLGTTESADETVRTGETVETDQTNTTISDVEEERRYVELDEPAEADLVELQGESTQLIDARELETAEYAFLQLDTDGVDATLTDGSDAEVRVPGDAPLKFNQSFEIRADTRTVFTADFTPVERGGSGGYLLQPVASETTVAYETVTASSTDGEN